MTCVRQARAWIQLITTGKPEGPRDLPFDSDDLAGVSGSVGRMAPGLERPTPSSARRRVREQRALSSRRSRWVAFWGVAAALVGIAGAESAEAGPECDFSDADLVCDGFDNCSLVANGPNDPSNQVDSDQDGYGNACDTDYSNDGQTTTTDFVTFFLPAFTGSEWVPGTDHDGDHQTTTTDFVVFLSNFQNPPGAPGPSGLACAGTIPCLP